MNHVPLPATSRADAAPKTEKVLGPEAAPATKAKTAKPEPRLSALDRMYAYYDPDGG